MIVSLPIKYNLPSAHKPVNYTAADNKIDTHLKGVDNVLGTLVTSTITPSAPVTVTDATSTIAAASSTQIFNGSDTHRVTLPSPVTNAGKTINLKNIVAFAVNSATSNVVPINSATAGIAIIAATAGKFAKLQSDGTNWIIIESN